MDVSKVKNKEPLFLMGSFLPLFCAVCHLPASWYTIRKSPTGMLIHILISSPFLFTLYRIVLLHTSVATSDWWGSSLELNVWRALLTILALYRWEETFYGWGRASVRRTWHVWEANKITRERVEGSFEKGGFMWMEWMKWSAELLNRYMYVVKV